MGKNKVGEQEPFSDHALCLRLQVLLPLGLDRDIEERLSAWISTHCQQMPAICACEVCVPPDGGAVDFIAANFCGFGGHKVPGHKEKEEESEGWRPVNE